LALAQGCPAPRFLAAQAFEVGGSPQSLAMGDFNRDGKIDLAVANNGPNNITILSGKGDGTFQAAVNFSLAFAPSSVAAGGFIGGGLPLFVAAGDFNGDGKPDLAVAVGGFLGGDVSLLPGNGDGTFRSAVKSAGPSHPSCIAAGDFNGDGKLDVAVANLGFP